MSITYKLFAKYEAEMAIGRKLLDIHHTVYLLVPGCDVNDGVNITTVAISEV